MRNYLRLKAIKRTISMMNRTLTPNTTSTNSCTAAKSLSMTAVYSYT